MTQLAILCEEDVLNLDMSNLCVPNINMCTDIRQLTLPASSELMLFLDNLGRLLSIETSHMKKSKSTALGIRLFYCRSRYLHLSDFDIFIC